MTDRRERSNLSLVPAFRYPGDESRGAAEQEDLDATDRLYIVREDDSLSSIARKFYGTAAARRRIIEANRSLIRDPYLIEPGWALRIPA